MIVKLVRLDSNADDLPRIDVHPFGCFGIEHVVDRRFGFVVSGWREPEVCPLVWVAGMIYQGVRLKRTRKQRGLGWNARSAYKADGSGR